MGPKYVYRPRFVNIRFACDLIYSAIHARRFSAALAASYLEGFGTPSFFLHMMCLLFTWTFENSLLVSLSLFFFFFFTPRVLFKFFVR
ncbi:hypothetical protein AYI68_g1303 [Smittium mucronatum]|uniref:Uncharacterized protein n=1 Tax=Smittium mucronatum TaxID=133383 RepID=A0A1R0H622_9FUNG|nr:hypothetical protein AYI68_g1303 [Smittium mucronatum]